ncbi:MAG: SUMF1/EgtB/PvdO family nonheme iron enzyme [Pseudomonadota bacterium]
MRYRKGCQYSSEPVGFSGGCGGSSSRCQSSHAWTAALGVFVLVLFSFSTNRQDAKSSDSGDLDSHLVEGGQSIHVLPGAPGMVSIPAGTFIMGADLRERNNLESACANEMHSQLVAEEICSWSNAILVGLATAPPERRVFLHGYDIDVLEATTGDYRRCVVAGGCSPLPLAVGDTRYARDDWPMVNVTWAEAQQFCQWRGARLPTEAEWEKAARGTDGRRWPWGNADQRDRADRGMALPEAILPPPSMAYLPIAFAPDPGDGAKILVSPGVFSWSRSPYGLFDMTGNVAEWVADWFSEDGYAGMPTVDPRGPQSSALIYRGVRGGHFELPSFMCRTYFRSWARPETRAYSRGFRCAR